MHLCIVWERADGGVCVTHPAPNARLGNETDEQFAERIRIKDIPAGKPHHIQRSDALPGRRFREAWRQVGGGIGVDLPSARSIVMADLRAERNRRLTETDAEKNRLDDVGTSQEKNALRVRRQALRDLPVVVAAEIAAMTAEQMELHSPTWPI